MDNTQYMSGTGNNFIVGEFSSVKSEIEIVSIVADSLIEIDGVIFVEKINDSTVKMHYFNNDGSSAELCVNGIRCVAKYSIDNNLVDTNEIIVQAPIGDIKAIVDDDYVSISIYIPTYEKNIILVKNHECIKSNIGNPHLLVKVSNVKDFNLIKFAEDVKNSELLEGEANIEIYNLKDKRYINARVFERGVGETDACGSGAICMFYYLYDTNQIENNAIILYPGGELEMSYKNNMVFLKGKVTYL